MISVPDQQWHEWPLTHNADLSAPRGSADPFWRGAFCNSTLGCVAINNMLTVTTLSPSLADWPSSCFLLHSLTTAGNYVTYSAQEMLTPPNMISPCGHTLYLLGQSSIVHRTCVLWFWCSVIKHTQYSCFNLSFCQFFPSRPLLYSNRNVWYVDQQAGCVWCSCWAPVRRPKKDKVVEKQPRCHFHSCTLHHLPPFSHLYRVCGGQMCYTVSVSNCKTPPLIRLHLGFAFIPKNIPGRAHVNPLESWYSARISSLESAEK